MQHYLSITCLLLPIAALAQQADAPTIQTLIQEVRQLRMAIEKSSTIVPRVQITLARFQTQQGIVERLEHELRGLQGAVAAQSATRTRFATEIDRLEQLKLRTDEPAARKKIESDASSLKQELEQQTIREQQTRTQEADLTSQLRSEQAKLSELANQLDQLAVKP